MRFIPLMVAIFAATLVAQEPRTAFEAVSVKPVRRVAAS